MTTLIGVDPRRYHADDAAIMGAVPRLSASMACVLDTRSPAHAHARHPRLGGCAPEEQSDAFDLGSVSHALLLGTGRAIEVVDAKDFKTKVAQEARDAARARGSVPVLRHRYDHAVEVADTLRQRFADLGYALDGASEVVALWDERADNGNAVPCKAMFDHVAGPDILDLKSCASAHPEAIQRSIEAYGYAIQRGAYVSGLETIEPRWIGRVTFTFLFYELVPPFVVHPVQLAGSYATLGARKWRRSVNTWERCMREDEWPGYAKSKRPTPIDAPGWAEAKDMDRHMDTESIMDGET